MIEKYDEVEASAWVDYDGEKYLVVINFKSQSNRHCMDVGFSLTPAQAAILAADVNLKINEAHIKEATA